jgi:hypothetical protein
MKKYLFSRAALAMVLAMAMFSFNACDELFEEEEEETEPPTEDVFVLSEINFGDGRVEKLEYDSQDRIKKIIETMNGASSKVSTITYSGEELTSVKTVCENEQDYTVTFTRDEDNDVVVQDPRWVYEDEHQFVVFLTDNNQGLATRLMTLHYWNDDYRIQEIYTYTYSGKNLSTMHYIKKQIWEGEYAEGDEKQYNFTTDNKNSPFFNSKTPQWWILYYFGPLFSSTNNIVKVEGDNDDLETFTHTFDSNDLPTKSVYWYNKDESGRTYTFKYVAK